MNHEQILRLAAQKAKGKRPYFLESTEVEKLLSMVMALTMELSVTRERVDTLERLLENAGLISAGAVNNFVPNDSEQCERSQAQQHLISQVLRILQQDIDALNE